MSRTALSPLIKAQVEKLTANTGGQRFVDSSSPIIIPKKATCSNTSSQSSSSYTSIADQMSSLAKTFLQNSRDVDHVYTSLPMLPSTFEKLEHTAARDRIQVKNKRQQQPSKRKFNIFKDTINDNSPVDIFISTSDDKQEEEQEDEIVQSTITTTMVPQITVDLTDLNTARSHLRPRDRSADNIISTTSNIPIHILNVQRSISFKCPQEINEAKYLHRTIRKIEKVDDETKIDQKKPTEEHIYDNFDILKPKKINDKSDIISTTVNIREHTKSNTARLRPVTMHIASTHENQTSTNEFENVFNQLKKRNSTRQVQSKEEEQVIPVVEEPVQTIVPTLMKIEEPPNDMVKENEPIAPVLVSTNKITLTSSITQSPNRRRTVGGVHLPNNNKVATEEMKPTPSWIDIAKQKQNKFQTFANEIEEQKTFTQPTIVSTKQINITSNSSNIQENISTESRVNQKPIHEPVIIKRTSPVTTTQTVERDSIRAIRANNPNRINNLIQFFDK